MDLKSAARESVDVIAHGFFYSLFPVPYSLEKESQ
jgi:hypothetical protein